MGTTAHNMLHYAIVSPITSTPIIQGISHNIILTLLPLVCRLHSHLLTTTPTVEMLSGSVLPLSRSTDSRVVLPRPCTQWNTGVHKDSEECVSQQTDDTYAHERHLGMYVCIYISMYGDKHVPHSHTPDTTLMKHETPLQSRQTRNCTLT